MNELDLIAYIRQQVGSDSGDAVRGIGDDCAVIEKDRENVWLLTMDTLIESVHFDCSFHPPELLGQKAVTVNISDIAAMGGTPVFALLSLGLPAGFTAEWAERLTRGIIQACRRYGCLLVGGDTVCSPDRVSLTLTLIGEMKRAEVLYRHTAESGDTIWVSGPLGASAAGLALLQSAQSAQYRKNNEPYPLEWQPLLTAHLDPQARTELGAFLARTGLVHAMMDLSDGLATDLAHICTQSKVGARIEAAQVPGRSRLASAAALLDQNPLTWMITGGEDYELLFTATSADSEKLLQLAAEQQYTIYPAGQIVDGQGVVLIGENQQKGCGITENNISFHGYDHFKAS